jgi:hypothetical protein
MVLRISVEIKQNGSTLYLKGSELAASHVTSYTLMQSEGNGESIFIIPICSSGNGKRKLRYSLHFNGYISHMSNTSKFI